MKGKILAIIPARGGSKGIPGKNIKELNGKPLMAYTIEEALKCPEIDRLEEDYEYVVLLQPTSPLRLAEDITGAIQKAVETGKDVVSVSKVQDPPVLMRQMDENGELASHYLGKRILVLEM